MTTISHEDLEVINKTINEQKMFGLSNEDTLKLVQERIGRPLSRRQLDRYKLKVANDNEVRQWITVQAKAGFLDNYRQRVEELLMVNQRLLHLFNHYTSKPLEEQNVQYVESLVRGITKTEALLSTLSLGAPVLLQVKDLIDKGLTNELFNSDGTKRLRENSTEDRDTNIGSEPRESEPDDDNKYES